jgi:subtilisin family serine protease
MGLLVVILSLSVGVPGGPSRPTYAQEKSGADVRAAVARGGTVRVNVTLAAQPSAQPGRFSRPILLREVASSQATVLSSLSPSDFSVIYRYEALPGLTGLVSQAGLEKLNADPAVVAVTLDETGSGAAEGAPATGVIAPAELQHSVPMIRADLVHAEGITGSGVTVAILDSGADTDHPDLADSISGQECFLSGSGSPCPNGTTRQSGPGAAEDDLGHGTNVTGIVTSNGVVSSQGVAPGANVLLYKVLNSSNAGLFSDWDAALNDIIAHHPEVRVVNMSLVSFTTFSGACGSFDPTTASAFSTLNAAGVAVFVSSGNNAAKSSMTYPACVPGAISVGAVYDRNFASSTFFGCTDTPATMDAPTCWSNSTSNLDLLAPGSSIVSDGLGGGTSSYTGTSQAAPHAAGAAALMLQQAPALTPDQLKTDLKNTGVPRTDPANSVVTSRIDAYSAISVLTSVGDTPTGTSTPTNTPTDTPTRTLTPTGTPTKTPTRTPTPTNTPTKTPTRTPTPTGTPTKTPTRTPTSTSTKTRKGPPKKTPTSTPTGIAALASVSGTAHSRTTGDGSVGIADLFAVVLHGGSHDPRWDVNGDGVVDMTDALIVFSQLGRR